MLPKVWNATGRLTTITVEGIANILDTLSSPAILITGDEHILAVNMYVQIISGYQVEEIIGLRLSAIFPNLIGRFDSLETINTLPDRSLNTILLTRGNERVPVIMQMRELAGQEVVKRQERSCHWYEQAG